MKLTEKLDILQNNHMRDWFKTHQQVRDELSDSNGMFCVCGRLATGLHESNCRKFNDRVVSETVRRLNHLLSFPPKELP